MPQSKENVAYLSDLDEIPGTIVPSGATVGNIVKFGPNNTLADTGKKTADYYDRTQTDTAIDTAVSAVFTSIADEYAIAAYKSNAWASSTAYAVGAFCLSGGAGYRCVVAHTSSIAFDPSKWDMVLSSTGKSAIDNLLASLTPAGGSVSLDNLASAFDANADYARGSLVLKDGALMICTRAGRGAGALPSASGATVDNAISWRIGEIERALDDILADSGAASFTPGVFLPASNGLYYRLMANIDSETGEVDIAVDQEGVER